MKMNSVVELWQYDFMRHAIFSGLIISFLTGLIGYFVMIRKLGFAVHALGHISFSGACAALLLGFSPLAGQLFINVISGGLMGGLSQKLNKNDLIISLTLGLALGVGTLFLHLYNGYAGQANIILFGNLFGVSTQDIHLIFILSVVTFVIFSIIMRPLWFSTLNPELAQAKGVSLKKINIIFFLLLSIIIALASQILGILLVFVLMIGPPIIAIKLTKKLWSGVFMSIAISIFFVMLSLGLSYWSDWPLSFWLSSLVFLAYCLILLYKRLISTT